jgi:hypothetical protein
MGIKELKETTLKLIDKYPKHTEDLREYYFFALSEIEEGGSETHECDLVYRDMLELVGE